MPGRKDELRKAVLNYLLVNGVANASLRPMAAALGTSARILMFHFKSKEGLLRAAFEELHAQLQQSFSEMLEVSPRKRGTPPLKRFWLWATENETAFAQMKLLYELQIIAVQNPAEYGRYLKKTSGDWQRLSLGAMSDGIRNQPMATLCVAVFDGLFLEFMSTGDRRRTGMALDRFIALASKDIRPGLPRSRSK